MANHLVAGCQASGGSDLDANYEDEVVKAPRRSKLDQKKKPNPGRCDQGEASFQRTLKLSESEVRMRGRVDEELQMALQISRLEQDGSEDFYDLDHFGETSAMGTIRNAQSNAVARGLLPDWEMPEWDEPSSLEPPPPYVP